MSKAIIVLGMHRSGTSLVANILHELGVNMGKNLLSPNPSNPRGYFENRKFVILNHKILALSGGNWTYPPDKINAEPLKNTIQRLINEEKTELWGFKDPCNTLTIEAYIPYLENPHFIICWRNPFAIAE